MKQTKDQDGKFDFDLKGHRQAVLDSYDPVQKAEEECIRALRTLGMSIEHGVEAFHKCGRDMGRTLNYLMGVNERGEEIDFKDFNFTGFSVDEKCYEEKK